MKELILLEGADKEYWYNPNTGDILSKSRGIIRALRKGRHRDDPGMRHVNIMLDGRYQFYTYHKLVALISIGIINLREIKDIISDRSNTGILKRIIIKDNDRSNGVAGNIVIGDMWEKLYYSNIAHEPKIDLTGLCCSLYTDTPKIFREMSVAKVPLEGHDIYVTTNGIVINIATGYVGYGHTSSFGYRTYTVHKNGVNGVHNVNRLMWLAFMDSDLDSDQIVVYKDMTTSRSITKLSELKVISRLERIKEYHEKNPDHFDKYLKEATNAAKKVAVRINGIEFKTSTAAAKYICEQEGLDKVQSVRSLISLRLNNRVKANKLIYKKYKVERVKNVEEKI